MIIQFLEPVEAVEESAFICFKVLRLRVHLLDHLVVLAIHVALFFKEPVESFAVSSVEIRKVLFGSGLEIVNQLLEGSAGCCRRLDFLLAVVDLGDELVEACAGLDHLVGDFGLHFGDS